MTGFLLIFFLPLLLLAVRNHPHNVLKYYKMAAPFCSFAQSYARDIIAPTFNQQQDTVTVYALYILDWIGEESLWTRWETVTTVESKQTSPT